MTPLACTDRARRQLAVRAGANGLDYVRPEETGLTVGFLQPWPGTAADLDGVRTPDQLKTAFGLTVELNGRDPGLALTVWNDADGYGVLRIQLTTPLKPDAPYALTVEEERGPDDKPRRLDPALARVGFRGPGRATADRDCGPAACPPARPAPAPLADYLAKDYASFRRLMFDRLARTLPGWTERRAADLGVAVVEVLAYAADHLSYFQDAVATEAYLDTARRRVSVRRHARLVDYPMHEGCNARAWVQVEVEGPVAADDLTFFTEPTDPTRRKGRAVIARAEHLEAETETDRAVFEPLIRRGAAARTLQPGQNEMRFYTWGEAECCLPAGATQAALDADGKGWGELGDDWLGPRVGDLMLIEEVLGPRTAHPADADPAHRHVVRLTRVELKSDWVPAEAAPAAGPYGKDQAPPLPQWMKREYLAVGWDVADAVPFAVCVATRGLRDVSVARGNVLLVDHGLTVSEAANGDSLKYRFTDPAETDVAPATRQLRLTVPLPAAGAAGGACDGPPPIGRPTAVATPRRAAVARFTPELRRPMTQAAPFPDRVTQARAQARWLARQRPAAAEAAAVADLIDSTRGGLAATDGPVEALPDVVGPARSDLRPDPREAVPTLTLTAGDKWTAAGTLLDSGPEDRHFVIEFDDRGEPWVRFGDGHAGRPPARGTEFEVTYRVGNGAAGNVGAEAITGVVPRDGIRRVRNPLPAAGGTVPEAVAVVKRLAPTAFKSDLKRAVATEDYARLAEKDDRVQRAAAELVWTGTGYEVRVAVDLTAAATRHAADPDAEAALVRAEIEAELTRYRRIGHAVRVVPPREVPLVLGLKAWLGPHADRARTRAALEAELGPGELPDGRRGLFHPDDLTFGSPVAVSRIVERARGVAGVTAVDVTDLRRAAGPEGDVPPAGLLAVGPLEVVRMDGDPTAPGRGRLAIELEGGR